MRYWDIANGVDLKVVVVVVVVVVMTEFVAGRDSA